METREEGDIGELPRNNNNNITIILMIRGKNAGQRFIDACREQHL